MANVTVYSTQSCPYCHMAKDFLSQHKVKFTAVDVQEDKKGAEEMARKSGQYGVPVIEIDGEIVVGFDRERIKQLLGL